MFALVEIQELTRPRRHDVDDQRCRRLIGVKVVDDDRVSGLEIVKCYIGFQFLCLFFYLSKPVLI